MKSIKDILKGKALPDGTNILAKDKQNPTTISTHVQGENESSKNTYKCSLCQDRGIYLEGDIAYPCSCMRTKKLENQFRHARISRDLMNCSFEKFRLDFYSLDKSDQTHLQGAIRALDAAKCFVTDCQRNSHGLGILYTGPVGSGKTYLAAAMANELMKLEKEILFLVVPDLLDELRATYKTEVNEIDLLDSARTIPILILDDLGAHNYTDWTRNRIYSIINYRLNEQLPTVITSNLTLDEMEEYIGVRTTSRIIQSSRIFRLTVEKDIRQQMYFERERNKS